MNTHIANLTNAAVMIVMGSWAYLSSANPSPTSLIPVFLGVILVVMSQGVKHEQKAQAHVAVVVTLLAFISLAVKPLPSAISKGESLPLLRVALMVITNAVALYYFIQSFIKARKNRAA
jgi:hypothetical protein